MLFNTTTFPLFLIAVLTLFHLAPKRFKQPLLVVASYVFYSFWNWKFSFLLLLSTVVDFYCGKQLGSATSQKRKNFFLGVSLFSNLGILGFFKYFNFFSESFSQLVSLFGFEAGHASLNIVLPVGISFYTFQTLSYTIDIWRGQLKPTNRFAQFALYVSFFPQLVAGPIERARRLLPQLESFRPVNETLLWQGALLLISGYLKKVVLSDQLSPYVDNAFANWETLSSIDLWEGLLLFTLQIYFDFSGYSDIARGVAKWFGIDLMVNFRQPYFAASVTDFWKRWHISLSSWLKEYLYIPLGGNRKGLSRTYINLMITMLLGGLWHGASYTFVFWGFLHGLYLSVHKLMLSWKPRADSVDFLKPIKILFTHLLIVFTWLPFRAPDFATAYGYFLKLFSFEGAFDPYALAFIGMLYVAMFVIDFPIHKTGNEYVVLRMPKAFRFSYITVSTLVIIILLFTVTDARPFIYFQF